MNQERDQIQGDRPEQSWGQGEGQHEPTIPGDSTEENATDTYAEGTGTSIEDPDVPLAREDEAMER